MEDLRYVARYLHGYRLDILVATLLIMGETVAELVIPFLMARIVDVGIASGSLALVLATGRRMVVVALLAGVCGLGYSHFSAKAAMGFGANLREAEYAHLQEYAFANLDEFESSSLVTRLTTDITVIQNAFVMGVRPLLRSPVMLVAGLVLACAMSARLAVVFFVILPFLAVALGLIVHHVAPQYAVLQGVMDRLNETLQEDLVAIRAIKAYVREGHVAKRFEDVNAALADTATHTFGGAVLNMPAFQAAMAVANVGLLWFGGQMVSSGEIGVGTLTGFMSYVLLIMNSLNMISSVFLLLARAVTSVGRVCEVLREKPAMDPNPTGAKEVTDGSVELPRAGTCWSTCRFASSQAPPSASWAARDLASPPWCSCCRACTTRRRAPSAWAGVTCATTTCTPCARAWGWCSRRTCSSRAPYATTCAGATRRRRTRRSCRRAASRAWTSSWTA